MTDRRAQSNASPGIELHRDATAHPSLARKVAFLRRRDTYPDRPTRVETIETHMSWVFLTDRLVYKLKKPIRYDVLDFGTRELRLRSCRREVRLNRRLARHVYLGVVSLTLESGRRLCLDGAGPPVDWLVKMRRLPEDRVLERRILEGSLERPEVDPAAALLAAFYAKAPPAPVDGVGYGVHLREGIRADRDELVKSIYRLPVDEVDRIADVQLTYVDRGRSALDRRVEKSRVVEGHGDLRPEHIFLTDPPAVIDCLEFSRDLRIQDPLDELTFLALECTRLGGHDVGGWFLETYRDATGDEPPPDLIAFYWRYRALRRAKVAVWHLRDPTRDDADKWRARAAWYLSAAAELRLPV
jgi:aminoglycoside phosphotransferase family enzyme